MFKKVSQVAVAGLMLGALVGCGGTSSSVAATPVSLKVWGPALEQTLLQEETAAFDALHPEWDITWEYGTVEEPDLRSALLTDVAAGADVFAFPDDQITALVAAGALSEVQSGKADVIARNVAGAVAGATKDGKLYAYPQTADNGFFMFYDSSAITLAQMGSLDSIMAVAHAAGKKILFDPSGGWKAPASFFLNEFNNITYDGTTQTCDWNNANGLKAAQGMWNAFGTGDLLSSGTASTLFQDGTILAAVTGTWDAAGIEAALGANYAATKMPTYTNGANEQVQMGSFTGSKLVGVNAMTAYPQAAHAFANFITNEEWQVARFTARGLGPSNIVAGTNEAITSNIALAALAAQAPYGTSQVVSVGGTYWTPAGAFATMCYSQALGDFATLQAALDAMVEQIVATA